MIMNKRLILLFVVLIVAASAMLMTGCGYSLHRKADLPFSEISIGKIENLSLEPKLQDKLHRALVQEFSKNGIRVTSSAANILSGVVRKFEMSSLSEKKDITVEYRIVIEADFFYKDSTGKIREIKKIASPFIVSSPAARDMAVLLGSRDMAAEKAVGDVAMEIIGELIY